MNKPLTTRQKELIKLMRDGGEMETVLIHAWVINPDRTVELVHNRTVGSLLHRGLIEVVKQEGNCKEYSLTELGKNVQI
jgi:predicted transcriptional regulator